MPIVVKFLTESRPRDDMPPLEYDIITFEQPSGDVSARVATEQDELDHPVEYAEFINAEVIPTYEELLAEWRVKHPKPTAAQTAAALAKKKGDASVDTPVAVPPDGPMTAHAAEVASPLTSRPSVSGAASAAPKPPASKP